MKTSQGEARFGLHELKTTQLWKAAFAELLAVAVFVFISCGSTLSFPKQAAPQVVEVSLAFGFSLAALIQCIGCISGGHVNPAITMAFLTTGKLSLTRATSFITAQVTGAITGAALLYAVTPQASRGNLGATMLGHDVTVWQGVSVEIILTFFLVFTVFSTLDPGRRQSGFGVPLSIGVAVVACHIVGIKYTGCGINPARSFGPAVITNSYKDHWIFWVGPVLAGMLAGVLYELLFRVQDADSEGSSASTLRICNINCCQITCTNNNPEQSVEPEDHYYKTTEEQGIDNYPEVIELETNPEYGKPFSDI